jgi:hypothetical protein
VLTSESLAQSDRPLDPNALLLQIGRGNVLAISGGRAHMDNGALVLPVGSGYTVRVTLAANDTYTVERVFTRRSVRNGEGFTVHRVTDVYAEEVGEVAYQASCFRNVEFGEKVTA